MGRQTATCGHDVKEGGITFFTNGNTRDGSKCLDYRTWCGDCVYYVMTNPDYSDEIKNTDIEVLRDHVIEVVRQKNMQIEEMRDYLTQKGLVEDYLNWSK